ncbi:MULTISPECIES: three-helix bundle dimerization domain-containing protein [unclassified Geodermatophilus]
MTVTAAVVVAGDDGPAGGPVPTGDPFVEALVERLHAEYGVDRQEIRSSALEVLATFAGAPVQAFVPILVEKRLRATYRARRDERRTALPAGRPLP